MKHSVVTKERRGLILQALVFLDYTVKRGASVADVNRTLEEWIAHGIVTWPNADWYGSRNEPYYTGTLQHLQAMKHDGLVESDEGWRPAAGAVAGGLRRRAADVLRLKSEGKTLEEIAETLEVSTSLAESLANDPTGAFTRERKKRYCPSCGSKKKSKVEVCPKCQQRKADELLPPDTFRVYIERAQAEGLEMIFGVTPDFRRVIRIGTWRAWEEFEIPGDLTWQDGMLELAEKIGADLVS